MSSNSFACGNDSNLCDKEKTAVNSKEKSCCDNDADDKGGEGHCGHSNCGCASTCVSSLPIIFVQLKCSTIYNFMVINKVNFSYTTPSLSKGFSSIWLIPKIS